MVKHIILWKLKEELSEEEKKAAGQRVKEGLEALRGQIDGLEEIRVYTEALPTSNYDLMLETVLRDTEALAEYAVYPEHVRVRDEIIVPVISDRACFDFEV